MIVAPQEAASPTLANTFPSKSLALSAVPVIAFPDPWVLQLNRSPVRRRNFPAAFLVVVDQDPGAIVPGWEKALISVAAAAIRLLPVFRL